MNKEMIYASAAYEEVKGFRKSADGIEETYFAHGREANLKLTGDLYTLYRKAVQSGTEGDRLFLVLKTQLTSEKHKVRANSTAASLLVRYVFKHYTDAQVSKTSTVMNYCDSKGIDDLVAFVKKTKNGLEGVRQLAVKEAGTSNTATEDVAEEKLDTGFGEGLLRDSDSVAHIAVHNWVGDEQYKVLIAIRNEDDTADVKDTMLDSKHVDIVMWQFGQQARAMLTASKTKGRVVDANAIKRAEGEVAYAEQRVEEAEFEVRKALKKANRIAFNEQRLELQTWSAEAIERKLKLTALKKGLTTVTV